ncbi:MAG TPA: HEAT repeat domain-containing protein [Terriglobales bacterium]|nr:HEAT repeat domain-containing protein [Terriglobales bacterium]
MKKALLMVVLAAATGLSAQQPQLANAKLEQRSGVTLEQQVRATAGPAWVAYAEPLIPGDHSMCCINSRNGSGETCCGGCTLENDHTAFQGKVQNCQLEAPKTFYVFLRVSQGNVEKVRMFTPNCAIDAGGTTVYWLQDVKPTDSISYLLSLAEGDDTGHKHGAAEGAIAAIAMHQDVSADQALAKLMKTGHSDRVVEQATFWAGNARGSRGYEIISSELEHNENFSFRKHAVFALSQNSDPRAQQKMIDMARHDSDPHVRGESLFWLAQEAGKKVAGVITGAIEDDPNTEVKKKAVFALSEMPPDEGVPLLIQQAQKNANPVVRKEAMFWLGQSHDPRALDFITSVLQK